MTVTRTSIDWMAVTIPTSKTLVTDKRVTGGAWIEAKGRNGYALARQYMNGVIEYSQPANKNMGTHIVYSGKALRTIVSMEIAPVKVLTLHAENGHMFSRLDIAIDFVDMNLDIGKLADDFSARRVNTRVRSKPTIISKGDGVIETLYIGSKKKRSKLLRIYDKAREQGRDGEDWKRVELELRGKNATRGAQYIAESEEPLSAMVALVRGFCDFTHDEVWNSVMDSEPVYMPTTELSDGATKKWLLEVCATSLAKLSLSDSSAIEDFDSALQDALEVLDKRLHVPR